MLALHEETPVINRAVNDLDGAECVVLWAVRLCTHGLLNDMPVFDILHRILARSGAEVAVAPIDALVSAVHCSAERLVVINCVDCPFLSRDEERLLAGIACHQAGAEAAAEGVVAPLVGTACAAAIGLFLRHAAFTLAASDILLPTTRVRLQLLHQDDRAPPLTPLRLTRH